MRGNLKHAGGHGTVTKYILKQTWAESREWIHLALQEVSCWLL